MQKDLLSKSIGRATAWSFAAEIAAKIIVPVTNIILARLLTPDAFGIIASVNMVVSFADMFSQAGFQKYIVQHEYETKESLFQGASVSFWTNLSAGTFFWLVICIFRNTIADFVGNPGYGLGLAVAALSLPLMSFSSVQEALFQRQLNYKILFYRRILVSLLPFFVTIPLAVIGLGYWALIIGTLAGNLLKAVILTVASEWKPNLFFDFSLLKQMLSFSTWTLFESLAMWASTYIDILIISNALGAFYTGLYKNSQTTVTSILTIVTSATTTVLFSALSRVQSDEKKYNEIFYTFQRNVAVFVIPLGVGIFWFSDLITKILLGPQWIKASSFIGIWGLCTSLVCVYGTFSREVYRSKGKPKISLIAQILHIIFIVPICLYGVRLGFDKLIYYRSFAYLQIILVHLFFIKMYFKMSPKKMFLRTKEPILCSLMMWGGLSLFHESFAGGIGEFVLILICILFYFSALCLFKEYRLLLFEKAYFFKNKILATQKKEKQI